MPRLTTCLKPPISLENRECLIFLYLILFVLPLSSLLMLLPPNPKYFFYIRKELGGGGKCTINNMQYALDKPTTELRVSYKRDMSKNNAK